MNQSQKELCEDWEERRKFINGELEVGKSEKLLQSEFPDCLSNADPEVTSLCTANWQGLFNRASTNKPKLQTLLPMPISLKVKDFASIRGTNSPFIAIFCHTTLCDKDRLPVIYCENDADPVLEKLKNDPSIGKNTGNGKTEFLSITLDLSPEVKSRFGTLDLDALYAIYSILKSKTIRSCCEKLSNKIAKDLGYKTRGHTQLGMLEFLYAEPEFIKKLIPYGQSIAEGEHDNISSLKVDTLCNGSKDYYDKNDKEVEKLYGDSTAILGKYVKPNLKKALIWIGIETYQSILKI